MRSPQRPAGRRRESSSRRRDLETDGALRGGVPMKWIRSKWGRSLPPVVAILTLLSLWAPRGLAETGEAVVTDATRLLAHEDEYDGHPDVHVPAARSHRNRGLRRYRGPVGKNTAESAF